ncbi:conserved hypothetical protein [Coccidioides posadasii str. Silveira]|uniref:Uncharacterized protein n=1 Tax=Coccidioides posadasii (strain RMSCC 757 / Silveira) TaxID=443226 RepID=E9CYD0_COCPS|nr:conserved hypothetical protein [Coccidioides posadasii str. Silveira]
MVPWTHEAGCPTLFRHAGYISPLHLSFYNALSQAEYLERKICRDLHTFTLPPGSHGKPFSWADWTLARVSGGDEL